MQRIINNADDIVDEMLAGFVSCHSDIVKHLHAGVLSTRFYVHYIPGRKV